MAAKVMVVPGTSPNCWPGDQRFELIDGMAYAMDPRPKRQHQRIAFELAREIADAPDGSGCEANLVPFDVRLHDDAYGRPLVSGLDGRLDCGVGSGVAVDWARVAKGLPDSFGIGWSGARPRL